MMNIISFISSFAQNDILYIYFFLIYSGDWIQRNILNQSLTRTQEMTEKYSLRNQMGP
jgi:hypothetical protein